MLPKGSQCTGCGVCTNACPAKCIEMMYDEEGFLQPKIDVEKCVGCKTCEKVCPVLVEEFNADMNFEQPLVYAVRDKNRQNLQMSSSGGFFGIVAEHVISFGGCVFGVSSAENGLEIIYSIAESKDDLCELRGTKYVQAKARDCYQQVYEQLRKERMVLYTGTPCSVTALKNFLKLKKMPDDNLISMDIICHGVPSSFLYEQMVLRLEKKYGKKVKKYIFRPKDLEWGPSVSFSSPKIVFEDGSSVRQSKFDKEYTYYYAFLNNMILRKSCHDCRFAKLPRNSDFTIGDFWGIEEDVNFPYECKDGLSCVLINSNKAQSLFDELKKFIDYKEEPLELVIRRNCNLIQKKKGIANRERFYKCYMKNGLDKTVGLILRISIYNVVVNAIKRSVSKLMGEKMRNHIKKIIRH